MSEPIDYRALLLSFLASLTLADHLGDVGGDAQEVLKRIGILDEWDEWSELGDLLAARGVRTLYGTVLRNET